MTSKLLSVTAAADALGISVWTLRRMCYRGACASHKIGSRLLVNTDEIERIKRETERPRAEVA